MPVDSLFIGLDHKDGSEIRLPRTVADETFFHIRGKVASGKSTFLSSIGGQLLKPYKRNGRIMRDPVTVVEFGGDLAMHNHLMEQTETRCRTLSLTPSESYFWEPLASFSGLEGQTRRIASAIGSGLNLIYSDGYGRGFWSRVNFSTLLQAGKNLAEKGVLAPELFDYATELSEMASRRTSKDASEALFALEQLLEFPQLRRCEDPEKRIDFAKVLEDSECVYFMLPTLLESLAARAIGTFAIWALIVECAKRRLDGTKERRYPHLIIDEVGQISAGKAFSDTLFLARKFIQIFLAHQTTEQLRSI